MLSLPHRIVLLAGYCAYLDVENAMDPSLVESMGINTENLLISRPSSAENLLSVVNILTRSGAVDVIVVDSVSDQFSYMFLMLSIKLPLGSKRGCLALVFFFFLGHTHRWVLFKYGALASLYQFVISKAVLLMDDVF